MMQVKFFLYFAASLWKEDLTPLPVSSRFISEPHWSQMDLFVEAFYLWPDSTFPLLTFPTFAGRHPPLLAPSSFDYRFLLFCPLTPLPTVILLHRPHPPSTTGPSFVNLTVANLTCRRLPHLLSPTSLVDTVLTLFGTHQ